MTFLTKHGLLVAAIGVAMASSGCEGAPMDAATNPDQVESTAQKLRFPYHYKKYNIPWVSGGDADVFTQNGRATNVTVQVAWNPYPEYDDYGRKVIGADIHYKIEETYDDYTTLESWEHVKMPLPQGWDPTYVYCTDFSMMNPYWDKEWALVPFPASDVSGCISTVKVKFDGDGMDDTADRSGIEIDFYPNVL